MLRKLLIVAVACLVTIATPSAMFTVQAESAVSANDEFVMAAAAVTRTPTSTSKSNSATKTPTATSKSATKTPTPTSKSKTPTAAGKSGENRDLHDPRMPPQSATMEPTTMEPAITERVRITRASRSG